MVFGKIRQKVFVSHTSGGMQNIKEIEELLKKEIICLYEKFEAKDRLEQ